MNEEDWEWVHCVADCISQWDHQTDETVGVFCASLGMPGELTNEVWRVLHLSARSEL